VLFGYTKKVLVLAAHPDDAELAVGGLIARLRHSSVEVSVVNFTTSEYTAEAAERRRNAAAQASGILGHRLIWAEGGRFNQLEEIDEYKLVTVVDRIVEAEAPDAVIAPWVGDSHVDHARLARATIASSRRWQADFYACCPAEYRSVSYHSFEPNVFVDIAPFVEKKLAAINCFNYDGQGFRRLQEDRLALLWSYYGVLSGYASAEALLLLRARLHCDAKR
jgi:LmbE family N-acetylglucosaminyl deacetylase